MWLNLSYSEFTYFEISMMEYDTNTSSHYYSIQPIYSKPAQNLDVISKKYGNFNFELFQGIDYLKLGFRHHNYVA